MERITLQEFKKAITESDNNTNSDPDFKGVFSHTDKLEYYYQVDTNEFEYVYRHVPNNGAVYYTGTR